MKSLQIPKQNINPVLSSNEYGLRKSIPLRISSILKSSNILSPTNQTLAQVTVQYQTDQKKLKQTIGAKTPLIRIDQQKNKSSNLFTKKARNSVAPNFVKEKSLIAKHSRKIKEDECNQEEQQLDKKLMQLIEMITEDEKLKLNRCHSSITLDLPNKAILINKDRNKFQEQISLPTPVQNVDTSNNDQNTSNKPKRPSFLFKPIEAIRYSQPIIQPTQTELTKSSYFHRQPNLRTNEQRMSHYQTVSKVEKPQLRLCINCLSYVNTTSVTEHEQKCLGFHIILKMASSELIDFLNQKISDKLNQLKQLQSKINSLKKSSSQIDPSQIISLYQKKTKTDQVINDLDAIRLKALKRFHIKNTKNKKQ